MRRKKLLAHDWSSGCLATAYSVEKLFFCNNGISFREEFDKEYIEELKDTCKNENMKDSTEWRKNVFKKWANERNLQANLEECKRDVLDQRSSLF